MRLTDIVGKESVFQALKDAVKQAEQTVTERHALAVHSAHRDALYRQVLLACAITAAQAHDALGYFNPGSVAGPLNVILGRDVEIATFNNRLNEFSKQSRGPVLERIGQPRAYRYRFCDPLLVPFAFMDAVASGLIASEKLTALLNREEQG